MRSELNEKTLTVFTEGRIDSTNVDETESAINAIIDEKAGFEELILDVEGLVYISSAGLRMVLRLRKKYPNFRVVNASPEVYEIFEMTGFTDMLTVEKAFRQLSVDGCKVIGQGAKGIVYRYDGDTIVKVYKNADSLGDIKNERELARAAFILGIPTAISYDIVKVGDKYGSVFELLDAKSYTQLIRDDRENRDSYISEYALLLKKIHSTEVDPKVMPDIKQYVYSWLDMAKKVLSENTEKKLRLLIDKVPEVLHMLHCDYHTNNVMKQNGETLLIDMDTLSHGHPIFELANVFITYVGFGIDDKSIVEKFLGLPYEDAKYVWEKFLPFYLGTDDEKKLCEVEEKAKIISDIRDIRRILRDGTENTELGKKSIGRLTKELDLLASKYDTLEF